MGRRVTEGGWKVDMKVLFEYGTIGELGRYMEEGDEVRGEE